VDKTGLVSLVHGWIWIQLAWIRMDLDSKIYPSRTSTPDRPKEYAEALVATGKSLGVTVIDVWTPFNSDPRGDALFVDGLHLSALGAKKFYDLVVKEFKSVQLSRSVEISSKLT